MRIVIVLFDSLEVKCEKKGLFLRFHNVKDDQRHIVRISTVKRLSNKLCLLRRKSHADLEETGSAVKEEMAAYICALFKSFL